MKPYSPTFKSNKKNPMYITRLKNVKPCLILCLTVLTTACATQQSHRVIETEKVESFATEYHGKKTSLAIGNFDNRSSYMQGLFSSNIDRLGNQSKTILKTHLQQTNRFKVLDRANMAELEREAKLLGVDQNIAGARYAITGTVGEFGRKAIGDKQLFGILGAGKSQIAYAKVSLNVVDVTTSEIVYSTQGAGEYSLSQREVLGFGSNASYDATLNGKVLNLAITEAVNNLVRSIEAGSWKPE